MPRRGIARAVKRERRSESEAGPQNGRGAGAYLRRYEGRLAWIMGSSRSGSTWLLKMLGELERVVAIDDPHLGHHLGVWRPLPLAWAIGSERPDLRTLDQVKHADDDYFFSDRYRDVWLPPLRNLIRSRFGAHLPADAESAGRRPVVVVKEPGCQAAPMLFDLFPRARLVFLLRDGRDVVDSWLDGYRPRSWAIEEGAFAAEPSGRAALAGWLGSVWAYRTRTVAEVFSRLPREQCVLVRYEDLLGDTAGQLGRICSTLRIDVPESELAKIAEGHSYARVTPAERGPLHAVRTAEPGRWRRRSSAERQAMQESMSAELERWGYLPAGAGRRAA